MSDQIQRDLGRHEAEIGALKNDVSTIVSDVREIKNTLAEAKGGWKTLMLIAGAAGAAGALVMKFAPFLAGVAR